MAIYEHLDHFAGMPVADWDDQVELDPGGSIYRVALSYDQSEAGEQWGDLFAALLDHPETGALRGIVVGPWSDIFDDNGEAARVVEALVAARDRLPSLRAIFFGDIISEECEISWIQNTDMSALLDAYPALEHFGVRGGNGLTLGPLRHRGLRTLIVQAGGLDAALVRGAAAADLPALEHLELWLGTPDYGGNAMVEDLGPLLGGAGFPQLRYLGLRDSAIADLVAQALLGAPILERIRVLDLSLGTLGDEGALALLANPAVRRLEKLDIHHHYCTPPVIAQLQALGIELDAGDSQEGDEYDGEIWRYVAVGE
jgi:hypothetical protein